MSLWVICESEHRAKNILMLFGEKGVGIDRIKLTNTQIHNIIDYVNDKPVTQW